ncbi:maleylpyruvate isomerase family mycothiol-dependent enzyme [Mariniluteicoccus flavus]
MTAWLNPSKPSADLMADIDAAYERLVDTLDSFDADGWRAPSLLPGWTRAHVVAHLNDNAVCFAEALEGLSRGATVPVYASDEARNAAIEEGATLSGEDLLAQGSEGHRRWRQAIAGMDAKAFEGEVERVPGGVRFPAAVAPILREREIEMHHADLDAGYGPDDWSTDFVERLMETLLWDMGEKGDLTLETTDTGARHELGAGGQVIRGTAARLAWWLARQDPSGLESDADIPDLGPWQRRPR